MSPQTSINANVEAVRDVLAEERAAITLTQQPMRTLSLFSTTTAHWLKHQVATIARKPVVRRVVIPAALIAAFISRFVVSDQSIARECEYMLVDGLFWLVLGILSSIGLGTGMHSGVLFLFPHIYLTCAAATTCGDTNFWTYPSNPLYGPRDRRFVCLSSSSVAHGGASFWHCLAKVIPPCILWGAGTAIGEVPPYALSYAAALQGKRQKALVDDGDASTFDVMDYMKRWTLSKIERYGFWAILLLAAWPNMAFDLCGMACGQFLMPFSTFFGATFVGKALIKVNLQAVFFVLLFSGDNIEREVRRTGLSIAAYLPARLEASAAVEKAVAAIGSARHSIRARATGSSSASSASTDGAGSVLMTLMQWAVTLAVLWFAKSIVDTFAQGEQERRDEQVVQQVATYLSGGTTSRSVLGRGELNQLIEQARGASPTGRMHQGGASLSMSRSRAIRQRVDVYAIFFVVVLGLMTGQSWVVVLGTNLLFHRFLFVHLSSNFSLRPWQQWLVRAVMAAVVLYALASQPPSP